MIRTLVCTSALVAYLGATATFDQKPAKPKPDAPEKKSAADELDAPDVADVPSQDLRLDKDENKRYLLAGPLKEEREPKDGYALLVAMPGGEGTANFHPFIKRIYKNALPDGFLVVQPVPPKWTPDQTTIWPTEKSKVTGMKFTTEEFVEGIIEELEKTKHIDPARVFTLSWSSSGPAAYVISTRKKGLVKGSYIAMSVFQPDFVDAERVKDKPYYILHSPDDTTCPFKMAEEARETLKKKGAKVAFGTYLGGHGWQGNVFANIRNGMDWLLDPKTEAKQAGKGEKEKKKP